MDEKEIYKKALEKWGKQAQLCMAIEELAELIQAINKYFRNLINFEDLAEEMADVEIMMGQLKLVFKNDVLVKLKKREKLGKLQFKLEDVS